MKLNKEDLMIGDWVMIKDYPMISEPKRMTENHFVRSLCEFEAIPLTNEFWLKNGFEFLPTKDIFCLINEQCLLVYKNGNKVIEIYKYKEPVGDIPPIKCKQFPIEYVHELQHILKLGKIDIEIKL